MPIEQEDCTTCDFSSPPLPRKKNTEKRNTHKKFPKLTTQKGGGGTQTNHHGANKGRPLLSRLDEWMIEKCINRLKVFSGSMVQRRQTEKTQLGTSKT